MKRASFAMVLSLLGPVSYTELLPAQEPIRVANRFVPRVSIGGAFDARNNGRGDPEMYFGVATLEWRTRVPGLALRADGTYARRDRIDRSEALCGATCDPLPGAPQRFSFFSSKVTAAGAMVGVTYDLRRHGAFRPYVLGSGGVVQTHDKFSAGTAALPLCEVNPCALALAAYPVRQRNDRPVSVAAQVGVGLVYSWRWISVLAETRYMAVDYANTRGLNGAVPVSLGLRF
jgi:hypothetical protein